MLSSRDGRRDVSRRGGYRQKFGDKSLEKIWTVRKERLNVNLDSTEKGSMQFGMARKKGSTFSSDAARVLVPDRIRLRSSRIPV